MSLNQQTPEDNVHNRNQREDLHRLVAEFAHDWDYFRDSQGRYPYICSSCERITGYTLEEFLQSPHLFETIIYPEDQPLVLQHFHEEMNQCAAGKLDFRIVTKDGQVRWIGHRCQPAYDQDGCWVGCRASNRDITERKEIEQALRDSEEKFRRLINHAVDAGLLMKTNGQFVDANLEAERVLGYVHDELTEMKIDQLDPELHGEGLARIVSDLNQSSSVTRYAVWRRKDGTAVYVEARIGRFVHEGETLVFLLVRDVTERQRAHEALRASEQKYRMIAESVSDVVWTLDTSEHFTYISPLAERLLGYSCDELKAMELCDVLTPEGYEKASAAFDARVSDNERGACNDSKPLTLELDHIRKNDSVITCEVSSVFLRDADGTPVGYIGMTRDITERKQAEEGRAAIEHRMRQAQKLESLGVLAGGIAHDFNNLLMSVLGNASLALEDLPPDSPCRELIEEIEAAGKRCADLCRQMLAYAGKGNFMVEMLDINTVVQDMVSLLRISVSKKAMLQFDLANELPLVHADASQIRQIVMSLITNAAEAVGDNAGAITLSTDCRFLDADELSSNYLHEQLPPGMYVVLQVVDNGCGMDGKILSQMFEPFFSTKFAGRGLGLSAVLGIVRAHKGALDVKSGPGTGTTFKVFLPAAQTAAHEASSKTGASPQKAARAILLVDDEEAVRKVAGRHLSQMGYEVIPAADGHEALALFAEHAQYISLVLLDLTMPSMSGAEVLYELQQMVPDVKVVLSSGYNEEQIAAQFAGKGLAGFIHKPYDRVQLEDKIHQILNH